MTIDWWTLAIQTVNVAILIWLLAKFFWRPVAAMIEARQRAAQALIDEAASRQTAAEAAEADIARIRAGFDAERRAILAEARSAAEDEHKTLLAAARAEADRLEAAARAEIANDRIKIEKALGRRAGELAVDIARRLVLRLAGPSADAAFLDTLVAAIGELPAETRAAADGAALTVTSAAEIAAPERERVGAAIAAALGGRPQLTFASDPELIAGLELSGPHMVVTNSWRADLTRILADLHDDDRS